MKTKAICGVRSGTSGVTRGLTCGLAAGHTDTHRQYPEADVGWCDPPVVDPTQGLPPSVREAAQRATEAVHESPLLAVDRHDIDREWCSALVAYAGTQKNPAAVIAGVTGFLLAGRST